MQKLSTKFTKSPRAGLVLLESRSLDLLQSLGQLQTQLIKWLLARLNKDGFLDLTPSHIAFLAALDCDKNIASEVARRLSITRQAVYKSVRELERLGILVTEIDQERRSSKAIFITEQGEHLIACIRRHVADLDDHIDVNNSDLIMKQILAINNQLNS